MGSNIELAGIINEIKTASKILVIELDGTQILKGGATCSCTPSNLHLRASITRACTPPASATSVLHLSSAAKLANAPAARS